MAQEETFQGKHKNKPEFKAFAVKELMMMKKHKKLISLLLALVMVFSFMAMSASAATTEVQPRAATCPQCGNPSLLWQRSYYDAANYLYYNDPTAVIYQCPKMGALHAHYRVPKIEVARCSTCGKIVETTTTQTTLICPYS